MYFIKTPPLLRRLLPQFTWQRPNGVHLTFDDGPIPEVTPWVLEQLAAHGQKATFFVIGDNVRKYPELLAAILAEGHSIGNHTYHHLNGWKTDTATYLQNVQQCQNLLPPETKLFRPPYGRITPAQANALRQQGYEIMLWDVLSGDFDSTISSEQCLRNVLNHLSDGSIVVFHDSLKAEKHLRFVLPKILDIRP